FRGPRARRLLAQGEQPGAVALPAPGGGERGGRGTVGVQGGEAFGDAEAAEDGGVAAVRREVLGGREGEGGPQPGAGRRVTRPMAGAAGAFGGEAAGQDRGQQEGKEQSETAH